VVNYFSQIGGNEKYVMNINTETTTAGNFVELKAISQIHFLSFKEYHKEEFLEREVFKIWTIILHCLLCL
jgi:hypothetical protein